MLSGLGVSWPPWDYKVILKISFGFSYNRMRNDFWIAFFVIQGGVSWWRFGV